MKEKNRGILYASVVIALIITLSLNLISAVNLGPTDVKITISNETEVTGGNDGGGGSSGSTPREEIETEEICRSFWECEDWDKCINMQRSRICTDLNNCEIPSQKLEFGFCIPEGVINKIDKKETVWFLLLIIIILLLIILIILLRRRKDKDKNKIRKRKR